MSRSRTDQWPLSVMATMVLILGIAAFVAAWYAGYHTGRIDTLALMAR